MTMHSVGIEALPEWLDRTIGDGGSHVAVMAGHFAIFSGGSSAEDLLATPDTPAGAREMLAFTRLTWNLACDVAATRRARNFQLVVLADDIQFVRPTLMSRSKNEQLAAALAADFYRRTAQLPAYHADALRQRGLGDEWVLRADERQWLFSERALRIAAVRHLRNECSGTRAGVSSRQEGDTLTVSIPGHADYCLIHSGHTTCAGGYVELLATLHRRGIRKVIALVPMRCMAQVAVGTALARHLLAMSDLSVVNVGIADLATGLAATVDDGTSHQLVSYS